METHLGETYTITDLHPSDDTYRVKMIIQEINGVPPDQQTLRFANYMELGEGRTLADNFIERESTIHLVLKLRVPMPFQPLRTLPFFTQTGTAGYSRAPTIPGTSKFMLHKFLKHLT